MGKLPSIPRLDLHQGKYIGMRGGLEFTAPDYYVVSEVRAYIKAVRGFQKEARKLKSQLYRSEKDNE